MPILPPAPPWFSTMNCLPRLNCHRSQLGQTWLVLPSLLGLSEVAPLRRRLVLPGRHEIAVRTREIIFLADHDVNVGFGAVVFVPQHLGGQTTIVLHDRPGMRQGVVDRRALVVKKT